MGNIQRGCEPVSFMARLLMGDLSCVCVCVSTDYTPAGRGVRWAAGRERAKVAWKERERERAKVAGKREVAGAGAGRGGAPCCRRRFPGSGATPTSAGPL